MLLSLEGHESFLNPHLHLEFFLITQVLPQYSIYSFLIFLVLVLNYFPSCCPVFKMVLII